MVMITVSTCKCDHVICVPFVRPWWLPSVSYLARMIIGTYMGLTTELHGMWYVHLSMESVGEMIMENNAIM